MWTERRSKHRYQRGEHDKRSPYERDRNRVIHSPAFRRLQRKTQILGTDEGDFHRTRLTHSLEVSSIGCSILRRLKNHVTTKAVLECLPDEDLIQVICLLHDIGHPPFGHGGEVALNYMMRHHGGFEGNGQTLRLLTKLETSYGDYGLDLTRRALLGILKYPIPRARAIARVMPEVTPNHPIRVNDWIPPKAYFETESEEVAWLMSVFSNSDQALFQSLSKQPTDTEHGHALYHSLDCSIMDIADDIAYGVHDLEDAIQLKLIEPAQLQTMAFRQLIKQAELNDEPNSILDDLFDPTIFVRKQAIGELVNYFVTSVMVESTEGAFDSGVLKYNAVLKPEAKALLSALVDCIYQHVIDSPAARTFEFGGQTVVLRLFEAISSNPTGLLSVKHRDLYKDSVDEHAANRIICDVIANMTDEHAYRMHERLFGLNTRVIFERM